MILTKKQTRIITIAYFIPTLLQFNDFRSTFKAVVVIKRGTNILDKGHSSFSTIAEPRRGPSEVAKPKIKINCLSFLVIIPQAKAITMT